MINSMMSSSLTISSLLEHASRYHRDTEIVSVESDRSVVVKHWFSVAQGARSLASALDKLGVPEDACCATLAWNNYRHLEIYFGVAGSGRICHTINPRLFPEQLEYIINHADDQIVFFDTTFLPLVSALQKKITGVKHFILMGSNSDSAREDAVAQISNLLFYDDLIASAEADYQWPNLDEHRPSSLCYTSGTTGHPKGVLYTHRSTVLHTMGANTPDGLAISASDAVMPVVPMFHVNAWGVPYVAAASGCCLVLPGPGLDGESLVKLIDDHKVSLALGVPTIWMGLLAALAKTGSKIPSLKRTIVGGSALPASMLETFRDNYDVDSIHAWGMTETSPLGTINQLLFKHLSQPVSEQREVRLGQGRALYGVELRLMDKDDKPVAQDGVTQGRLQVRGLWVVHTYFKAEHSALTDDGWFDTGDVATIDEDGYMIIRDRSKDMIKSGGEWISSVELENIIVGHPDVANAAAIAAQHSEWGERPVLVIVLNDGSETSDSELLQYFENKIAKWQIPDAVVFTDTLPLGGTGKVLKSKLREQFGQLLLE